MFNKTKCNNIFKIKSGTTPNTKNESYYSSLDVNWLNSGDFHNSEITETKNKISKKAMADCGLKEFKKNSVVIAMYGANIGEVGYLKIKSTVNQACAVLTEKSKDLIYSKYYFYWFISHKSNFLSEAYGGGQDNINQKIIAKTYVDLPRKREQQKIANFLDTETSKIDKKIELLEKKSEKLEEYKKTIIFETVTKGLDSNVPMKDSGIEWIGEIPNHWNFTRIKNEFFLEKGQGLSKDDILDKKEDSKKSHPCILYGELFTKYNLKITNIVNHTNAEGTRKSKTADILLPATTTTKPEDLAKAAVLYQSNVLLGSDMHILRKRNNKYNPLFIAYYITYTQQRYFSNLNGGVTISHSSKKDLAQIDIPFMNIEEQNEIVTFLETSTAKIDRKKEIIQKQIDLLKEYKQAVIFEAVTGKMEIL